MLCYSSRNLHILVHILDQFLHTHHATQVITQNGDVHLAHHISHIIILEIDTNLLLFWCRCDHGGGASVQMFYFVVGTNRGTHIIEHKFVLKLF